MCGHNDESLEGTIVWLQNTSHSWLLILDNADNKDLDLARFLPAGRNGSILITTRLIECGKHQTVGKDGYESLSHGTAIELLLKACGIDSSSRSAEEDNARAVAELLGYHALAIIQAGAAICEGYCNLGEYKENFLEHRQTLLDCFPGQAGSEYGGVYATFEVTVTYLEARGDQIAKDALQLLNFYAFMHFSEFPEAAFEEAWKNSRDEDVVSSSLLPDGSEDIYNLAPWHVSHLPAFMHQNPHNIKLNKIRLRQARSLLASLSLVTFDSARASTRMHPVSHFWSRDRLQIPDESMNAGLSGLSVLSLSIKYPYAVDIDPLVRQLQPHIESIVHSLKEWGHHKHSFHFQQSVYRLGYVMYRSGLDSALFEMLQMIPIQTDEFWIRTRNGQSIQLLHGTYTLESGDANKAVTLLEQINEARLQTLAPEDPDLLSSQHTLAMAYLDIEDVAKAIELLEQIVQTRNETLSPEHPGLLGSQHELARAYLKIDETIKAIALLESVVEIEAKTLRPEHPDLLISQSVLAGAYLNIKETAKAIALLEEVVDIETKTLRPEHSDRLVSQHELARAYLEIEETAKAIAILESVVSIRTRTLRPEHPDLLSSQHELARAYLRIDEAAKAIDLLEEVVEVKKRTLRPKHRELLVSQHELARAYLQIDETTKAITLLEKVVEIRTKTLRPEHSDLLASQHVLASAYLDIEETAKAIALLEPVVEIRARTLKADHPNRVRSIYLLARCHRKAGNYERAIQLARSIENIAQNRAGEDFADWNRELIGYILEEMDLEETSS